MTFLIQLKSRTAQLCAATLLACVLVLKGSANDAVEFTLSGNEGRPQSVAFDSKLSQLAALQPSGDVVFYDLHSGVKLREWKTGWAQDASMDVVPVNRHRLAFLGSDQTLLVASGARVGVFDAVNGKLVRELTPQGSGVGNLCVSKDAKRILAQCGNAMVAWDLESGAPLFTHKSKGFNTPRRFGAGHGGNLGDMGGNMPVSSRMDFNGDGSLVALGLSFEQIDLWSLEEPAYVRFRRGSSPYAGSGSATTSAVAFLPDGRLLGIFNFLNLEVFSTETKAGNKVMDQSVTTEPQVFEMHAIAVTVDGKKLVLGGIGARSRRWLDPTVPVYDQPAELEVQVLETTGFTRLTRFQGRTNECVGEAAWDAEGKRLAIVSGVGYTDFWTGTLQQSMGRKGGMKAASTLPLHVRVWTP